MSLFSQCLYTRNVFIEVTGKVEAKQKNCAMTEIINYLCYFQIELVIQKKLMLLLVRMLVD